MSGHGGPAPPAQPKVRVDRWLWSVRAFKTRTLATDACRAGHVAVNMSVTKASTAVGAGDVVTLRVGGRDRVLEVVTAIGTRVGATVAAGCFVDLSPPQADQADAGGLRRDPSTGRPTKRDRRRIDRLRDR